MAAGGQSIGRLFVELALEDREYGQGLQKAATLLERAGAGMQQAADQMAEGVGAAFEKVDKAAGVVNDGLVPALEKARARLEDFAAKGDDLGKIELKLQRARAEIEKLAETTGDAALAARALQGAEAEAAAAREKVNARAEASARKAAEAIAAGARQAAAEQVAMAEKTAQAARRLEELAARGNEVEQLVLKFRRAKEEIQQLANATGNHAQATKAVSALEREFAAAIAARNAKANEAAGALDQVGASATGASAGARSLAIQLPDIFGQLATGVPITRVMAQQLPQVAEGMIFSSSAGHKLTGIMARFIPHVAALGAALGALVIAYDYVTSAIRREAEAAEFARAMKEALVPTVRALEQAQIDYAVAVGDATEAEAKQLRLQLAARDAVRDFADAQREQRQEIEKSIDTARTWSKVLTLFTISGGPAMVAMAHDITGLSATIADGKTQIEGLNTAVEEEADAQKRLRAILERTADAEEKNTKRKKAAADATRIATTELQKLRASWESVWQTIADADEHLKQSRDWLEHMAEFAPDAIPPEMIERLQELSRRVEELAPAEGLARIDELRLLLLELEGTAGASAEEIQRVQDAIAAEQKAMADAATAAQKEVETLAQDLKQLGRDVQDAGGDADTLGNRLMGLVPGLDTLRDRLREIGREVEDGGMSKLEALFQRVAAAAEFAVGVVGKLYGAMAGVADTVTGGAFSSLLNPTALLAGAGGATETARQGLEDQAVEEARADYDARKAAAEASGEEFTEEFDEQAIRDSFTPDPAELEKASKAAAKAFVTGLVDQAVLFVEALAENLPVLLTALVNNFPRLIDAIVENLPALIEAIIRALPKIAVQLVIAIVRVLPVVVVELAKSLIEVIGEGAMIVIGALGQAFKAVFTDIIPNLAGAIVDGVVAAFKTVVQFFKDVVKEIVTLGRADTKTFNDTPGVVTAGAEGLLARFAPRDKIIAAQRPEDLLRQAVDAVGGGGRSSSAAPPPARAQGGVNVSTSTRLIVDGRELAAVTVLAAKRGEAPEVSGALRAGRTARVGFDRGKFNGWGR